MSQIVSPEQVIDLAPHIIKAGHTLLLEGAPGTAKTSLTRAVAEVVAKTLGLTLTESLAPKKKEYGYIKMHMGNHDPVDFTLPFTYDDNGVTRQGRATMDILPTQGRGLFVFEEVGQNPDVSRIVAQIVSERRLGDVHIPDGWDEQTSHSLGQPNHSDDGEAHGRGISGSQQGHDARDRIDVDLVP